MTIQQPTTHYTGDYEYGHIRGRVCRGLWEWERAQWRFSLAPIVRGSRYSASADGTIDIRRKHGGGCTAPIPPGWINFQIAIASFVVVAMAATMGIPGGIVLGDSVRAGGSAWGGSSLRRQQWHMGQQHLEHQKSGLQSCGVGRRRTVQSGSFLQIWREGTETIRGKAWFATMWHPITWKGKPPRSCTNSGNSCDISPVGPLAFLRNTSFVLVARMKLRCQTALLDWWQSCT